MLTPKQIEDRVKAAGLSMAEVLREANVDQSTWIRNKKGIHNINTNTRTKVMKAFRKLRKSVCGNAYAKTHISEK